MPRQRSRECLSTIRQHLEVIALVLCFFTYLSISDIAYSQGFGNLGLTFQSDIPSVCTQITMTMQPDNIGRPYLYVADKEGGLRVYNISNLQSPFFVDSIPITALGGLHVMNLSQAGNYLYLALGDHLGTNVQSSGMAVVDITNPNSLQLTDHWTFPGPVGGGGIVKVEGNYAYLGAMLNGLIILDISDKHHIQFVSQFVPDKSYPTLNPDTTKYNARGMQVLNGIVYLCYDAGGFRIVNTSNKLKPIESGRYSNPVMNGRPRAYNNIVVDDTLAYIAVDYCGLEVLSFADTSNVKLISWWNPWSCDKPLVNIWFNSPGHANEIDYDKRCKLLFLATGKSDMHVVSVANPAAPDSCDNYGGTSNNLGTWGVSRYDNKIFLSYICTLGIPFASNWTGVKILTYTPCQSYVRGAEDNDGIRVFPSLARNEFTIESTEPITSNRPLVLLVNAIGQIVSAEYAVVGPNKIVVDLSRLSPGIYFIKIFLNDHTAFQRVVKADY